MATYYEVEYSAYANQTGLSGITLNEQKLSFYNAQLSTNYNIVDEAEIAFLKNQTGLYDVNSTEHLWKSYLISQGVANSNSLQSMKFYFFENVGFTNLQSYIKSLSGLVGYWPLDEVSGDAINQAPATFGSHNGTVSGATQNVDGLVGKAYSFDGVNDWISVANNAVFNMTGDITMFALVYRSVADTNFRDILTKNTSSSNSNRQYGLGMGTDHKVSSNLYNSSTENKRTSANNLSATTWYFVVGRRANSTHDLFINGVNVASGAFSNSLNTSSGVFAIGRFSSLDTSYWRGLLQHVGIVNVGLSDAEILQMAQLSGL